MKFILNNITPPSPPPLMRLFRPSRKVLANVWGKTGENIKNLLFHILVARFLKTFNSGHSKIKQHVCYQDQGYAER